MKRNLLPIALLCFSACASGPSSMLLNSEARASLSHVALMKDEYGISAQDETSPEIRGEVMRKIRGYMTRVGRYPESSVQSAVLVVLQPQKVSVVRGGSFSYRALVQVDRPFAASQLVEFNVFDRNGTVVVKKTSL